MVLSASKSIRSAHPWIDAAVVDPTPQKDILKQILQQVREDCQKRVLQGGKPIKVVFDLDSTIFNVQPRTLRIAKEFAQTSQAQEISVEFCNWFLALKSFQLSYTIRDTVMENNFPIHKPRAEEFMKSLYRYWRDRFFSDAYLYMDHPAAGAQEYAHAVVDAGAIAVYLTGRDYPGMERGTRSMLAHWGFPVSERNTRLVMKPNFGMDDAEFKDEALRELRTQGEVVALFDNEPANFYVFEKNFPSAKLVFFHSNCSNKEAKPVKQIYRIENFLFR